MPTRYTHFVPRRSIKQWSKDFICKIVGHKWVEGNEETYNYGHRDCARCGKHEMLYIDKYPSFKWE